MYSPFRVSRCARASSCASLLLLFSAQVAHAQTVGAAGGSPPAAGDAASPSADAPSEPAAAAAEGRASPQSAATPDDARYQNAKQYFERGVVLFEAGNYDAALVEFQKAYDLLEGHPKRFFVLDNIGQCQEKLFRYDLALKYYRRYLAEGGRDAEDHAAVEATMRALEGLLATLQIRSNVRAEVWVDDRRMGEAPGDVLLPGGRHVVELRAAGHEPQKRELSISARETQKIDVVLDPIEEYRGLSPVYFWSGVAATGVAAGVGTYFGLKAKSQHDDLAERESSCGAICILPEERDDVKRTATTADLFYLGAAVLGVGTTVVFFMTDFDGKGQEAPQPKSTAFVTPVFGASLLGLEAQGAF